MEKSNFITQFYNLEGDLISERKKNFFKLLKAQQTPLNEEELKNLRPRTYLERLFEIDIFIYYKMATKLLDIIKGGNKVFVKKILKHPRILKEAFVKMSPKNFVKEFFPSISYSTRMKILNKIYLIMNESQMDEIIFWLENEYGVHTATKILHTCSATKIKHVLFHYEIILSAKQIKFIFDKDTELFIFYLNYYKTLTGYEYSHCSLSRYVALKDPKLWLKLKEENTIGWVTLGYRTSTTFIRHNKTDFLNNIKNYSDFLREEVIVYELHEQFNDVYADFFPNDKNNINTDNLCHKFLRHYPKKKQWDMFEQTYKKVFDSNVESDLIYLNYNFIQLFANKSIRNMWAEVHYSKYKNNYILQYCNPKMAIPLITNKLNVAFNFQDISELVGLLLENCAENEDLLSLEEVLKFIYDEYSNEDIFPYSENIHDFFRRILHKIVILFKFEQFNENHWNYFNKILVLTREEDTTDFYYFTDVFFCELKYIEHLCIQGKPFQNELITFINEIDANKTWFYIDLENPEIEKKIWIETIKTYPTVIEMDDKTITNFIKAIIEFNEEHPDHTIDISHFPHLLAYLNSIFNQDTKKLDYVKKDILKKVINFNFKFPERPIIIVDEDRILEILVDDNKYFARENPVEEMVTKKNRSRFENDVLNMLWENMSECRYLNRRIISWFLINEPNTIVPYFDKILQLDKKIIDISYVKLMSHLELDRKVMDYCMNKLECIDGFLKSIARKKAGTVSSEDFKTKFKKQIEFNTYVEIIKILSLLLPTSEYIEIIKRFLPIKGSKQNTEESLNIYFLQCEVVKYLKNLEEPAIVLPAVTKFCLDEYLEPALCSLYSICYKTPEQNLYSYVDQLSKARDESVRKHALFLSCELLNFNYVLNGLRNANDNYSCKKYVFTATLKYFRKNPSDELLSIITANINRNDDECMYIQMCWEFFESLRRKDVSVQNYLQFILDIIISSEHILVSLPPDFYRNIIALYFKDPPDKDHHLSNIHTFVCLFLRNEKSEQSYNFKFVFDIIGEFKRNKNMEMIKTFFYHFYDMALQDVQNTGKCNNNFYIEMFRQHWFLIFSHSRIFDECFLLNLLYFRYKSDASIENYAKDVVFYLERLVGEFGPDIYDQVKNLLMYKDFFTEKEKYLFFYNILITQNSFLNYLLILDLLDDDYTDKEAKEIYMKIIDILKHSKDPDVSNRLKSYLEKSK